MLIMGRRSLQNERTEQIIMAFIECVKEYGLEGASLERTAEKAGVKRSIIRHYVGNRDKLIEASVNWIINAHLHQWDALMAVMSSEDKSPGLIEFLFPESSSELGEYHLLLYRLLSSACMNPHIQKLIVDNQPPIEKEFVEILSDIYPRADTRQCSFVAYGLLSLRTSYWMDVWLGLESAERTQAILHAAQILLASLQPSSNSA